jgi:peptide/nickel transport system substrate-binding protein
MPRLTPPRRVVVRAAALVALAACAAPARPPGTVVFASGTDLESANPLVTVHSLSRQLQRHALFVTLARYDERLEPAPYLARRWHWSADRRTLTLALDPTLRWHDGRATTARDVAFTLDAARDPATGYPRYADLAAVASVAAPDSATVVLAFAEPQPGFPVVLCELPVLPAHLLDRVPRARMRQAAFNERPVGNGPFRFERRDPGSAGSSPATTPSPRRSAGRRGSRASSSRWWTSRPRSSPAS